MLICFDYDGVVVDSLDVLLAISKKAWRTLESGREPEADDFRLIEQLQFDAFAARIGIHESEQQAFINEVIRLQSVPGDWPVDLFDGIPELLSSLSGDHHISIVTASSGDFVRNALEGFGISEAVHSIYGAELGLPKSERIRMAMAKTGTDAANAWMVGDAISDIREGKLAGAKTIAVTWGYQPEALLAAESPDHVVGQPEAIASAIAGVQI
jgi:phosphoglycolate phosphatase